MREHIAVTLPDLVFPDWKAAYEPKITREAYYQAIEIAVKHLNTAREYYEGFNRLWEANPTVKNESAEQLFEMAGEELHKAHEPLDLIQRVLDEDDLQVFRYRRSLGLTFMTV